MTKIAVAGGNDNHCLERALELQYHSEPGVEAEVNLAEVLPLYGVILLMQETSHEELVDLNKELPTDTHLVAYRYPDGTVSSDAVRRTPRALAEISRMVDSRLGSFARRGGGENSTLVTHGVWLYPGMALATMLF